MEDPFASVVDHEDLNVEGVADKARAAGRRTSGVASTVKSTVGGLRAKYPPMPDNFKWRPYYDAGADKDFNGLVVPPPYLDIRPASEVLDEKTMSHDMCVIVHGINADKKPAVWRSQSLEMIKKAARRGYRHFYVPLVQEDHAGSLEDVTSRVYEGFKSVMMEHRIAAQMLGQDATFKKEVAGRPAVRLLLIGVSNGGRIVTRMEMMMRREGVRDLTHYYQLNVLTIASPLAGTSAVAVLPSKLNSKIYGKEFKDEMRKKLTTQTLAELARNAKPQNVTYWHVTLDEDILVWYANMPEYRRLVNFDPEHVLRISGIPHWLVQENVLVLDLIDKIAEKRTPVGVVVDLARAPRDKPLGEEFPDEAYLALITDTTIGERIAPCPTCGQEW